MCNLSGDNPIRNTVVMSYQNLTFICSSGFASFSSRAFFVAAHTVWNQLSANTRAAGNLGTFESKLNSELFITAYPSNDGSVPSEL